MVSVVVARSGEQSPQPARWIGVFVVVARILDYMCGSAVLDFGKGREVHHRMLGEACGVAYIRRFLASNDCEACGVAHIRRFLASNDCEPAKPVEWHTSEDS